MEWRGKPQSWTPERVARLLELWEHGLPYSLIAKRLGGVTREAVCGKCHRLGLIEARHAERKALKAKRPRTPADRANVRRRRVMLKLWRDPEKAAAMRAGAHKIWAIGRSVYAANLERKRREAASKARNSLPDTPTPAETPLKLAA